MRYIAMSVEFIDKLEAFHQISQLRLIKILDSIQGSKDLIIDGSLIKPLERCIGIRVLKSHGVDKIWKLDKKETIASNSAIVYLVRSDLITVKRACDQISSLTTDRQCHIILMPNIFHSIKTLIEEEGLFAKVKLHSFQWELITLDTRVLSFECHEVFKYLFVLKDPTYLEPCAKSLWSLQHVFGKIPFKIFLGAHSKSISSLMTVFNESMGEPDSLNSDVGLFMVVDRDIDYASVLLTPSTYTSLVGDVIGINTGIVEVPKKDSKVPSTIILTSENETYNEIKHQHFSSVITYLAQKINKLHSKRNISNMNVQELRQLVKGDLKEMAKDTQTLFNHLNVYEKVTNEIGKLFERIQGYQQDILLNENRKECLQYIEELMVTGAGMNLALRLICLLSSCQNGLTQSEATNLKYQFLHAYGHEHLLTIYNLEKMRLFSVLSTGVESSVQLASKVVQAVTVPRKSVFQSTVAKLKLIPSNTEAYDVKNPDDFGYVFGGIYIPLIVQLVSSLIKKEKTPRELLKCLPGEFAESSVEGKSLDTLTDINPRCVWVYVVGGITYAEIAAFALLEKKTGCRIVCSGSNIINGNTLVQSAL